MKTKLKIAGVLSLALLCVGLALVCASCTGAYTPDGGTGGGGSAGGGGTAKLDGSWISSDFMTITIAKGKFTAGSGTQTQSGTVSVTGNTITFTSDSGKATTATLSDDGKSFTMEGETFKKQ
jgi:hypothetical protein